MRIHCFQHATLEGPDQIEAWARDRGHDTRMTCFERGDVLPDIHTIDWLVVMGGAMGVADEAQFPWLVAEKAFIRQAIATGKRVLGICLGAQLIAEVLGARVTRNREQELGWFPVTLTPQARDIPFWNEWPSECTVFHWHGETFEIPAGAIALLSSQACAHQAFAYGKRVVGLQFHLELSPSSIRKWLSDFDLQAWSGSSVQSPEKILAALAHAELTEKLCRRLLDYLCAV